MNTSPAPTLDQLLEFPDWPERLAGDESLPPRLRHGCRLALTRFLAFGRRRAEKGCLRGLTFAATGK